MTKDIEVYSIIGKLMKTISPSELNNIDISDLASGTYIVKVNLDEGVITKKIVIKSYE